MNIHGVVIWKHFKKSKFTEKCTSNIFFQYFSFNIYSLRNRIYFKGGNEKYSIRGLRIMELLHDFPIKYIWF